MSDELPGSRLSFSGADLTKDSFDYYVDSPKDGVSASCRIDTATKARLSVIVQDRRFRYKTESDIIRAAVHWFLLEKIGPRMGESFEDDLRLQHLHIIRAQAEARMQDRVRFVKETVSSLRALILNGALEQAQELWSRTLEVVERSREPFKSKVTEALMSEPDLALLRERAKETDDWSHRRRP